MSLAPEGADGLVNVIAAPALPIRTNGTADTLAAELIRPIYGPLLASKRPFGGKRQRREIRTKIVIPDPHRTSFKACLALTRPHIVCGRVSTHVHPENPTYGRYSAVT